MKVFLFFSFIIFTYSFAMHNACYQGRLKDVQSYVDHEWNVDEPNGYGLTPLMMAVQMLTDFVHTQNYPNYRVPPQNYYDIAVLLLRRGAFANAKTKDGRSALDLCEQNTGGTPTKIAVRENIKKLLRSHMTTP